ncbi:MAG: BPSL0067 family protein [Magnetospirillum sp.]|nr:BPSL0067 family protein [Magnetospirillum sp.]
MPDTNQPRDDHGRWAKTASEHGYVIKDFDARMAEIIASGKQVGESKECVALVKHLAPEVGRAADWQEGPPILGYGNPPLERGTPIATFEHYRYQNNSTGNHAAIFLEYGLSEGRTGMWVLDQSNRLEPNRRHIPFRGRAERYSVIKRR